MFLIVNKKKLISVNDAYLFEVWSQTKLGEGMDDHLIPIFLVRQHAYIIKILNNLGDEWELINLGDFLKNAKTLYENNGLSFLNESRFGFVLGFKSDLENYFYYKRLVKLTELTSDYNYKDWAKQATENAPSIALMIQDEINKSDEEVYKIAKYVVNDLTNNSKPKVKVGFWSKILNRLK